MLTERTALHSAARGGHTDTVEVILNAGASLNATDNEGKNHTYDAEHNNSVMSFNTANLRCSATPISCSHTIHHIYIYTVTEIKPYYAHVRRDKIIQCSY